MHKPRRLHLCHHLTKTVAQLLALGLAGCTVIHSERVDPDRPEGSSGLHYYLPKPAIEMVPTATGGVAVEVRMLPDADHEYTLDSYSIMATHRLEVERSRGMLSKVGWQADSSAVVGSAVVASGEVAKNSVFSRAKAEKGKRDAIAQATDGLATAEKEYQISKRKLESYAARADEAARTAEKSEAVTLIEKDEARRAAQAKLDAVKNATVIPDPGDLKLDISGVPTSTAGALSTTGLGDATSEVSSAEIRVGKFDRSVHGGLILLVDERLSDNCDADDSCFPTVALRPLRYNKVDGEDQVEVKSTTLPRLVKLALAPVTSFVAQNPEGRMDVELTFNADVIEVESIQSVEGGEAPTPHFTFPRKLVVDMRGFARGEYEFEVKAKRLVFSEDPVGFDRLGIVIVVTGGASPPVAPAISPSGKQTVRPDATSGLGTLQYVVSGDVYSVTPLTCQRGSVAVPLPSVTLGTDKKLTIDVTGQTSGEYTLELGYKHREPIRNAETSGQWTLLYRIPGGLPALLPSGTVSVRPNDDGVTKAEFELSRAAKEIHFHKIVFSKAGTPEAKPAVQLTSPKKLAVDLTGVAVGDYLLEIPFAFETDDGTTEESTWAINLRVQAPKK